MRISTSLALKTSWSSSVTRKADVSSTTWSTATLWYTRSTSGSQQLQQQQRVFMIIILDKRSYYNNSCLNIIGHKSFLVVIDLNTSSCCCTVITCQRKHVIYVKHRHPYISIEHFASTIIMMMMIIIIKGRLDNNKVNMDENIDIRDNMGIYKNIQYINLFDKTDLPGKASTSRRGSTSGMLPSR